MSSATTPATVTSVSAGAGAPVTLPWLRKLLWLNLIVEIGIVVTGGLVRLTGSGLGCPTWPECTPGSYVPTVQQEQGIHKFIEFGNRTLTGLLGFVALALLIALWRKAADRRDLRTGVLLVLVGIAAQAIVGGITVLTSLNPWIVAFHFLASMSLIAVSAWLVWRSAQPGGRLPLALHPLAHRLSLVGVLPALAAVLVLGTIVTGSGPHSGDAEAPARTGFDPRTVSWLHADSVMLFVGLVVGMWLAARMTSRSAETTRAWGLVVAVTLAQGLIGYVQYFTDLPELLVLAHMLGASILVVVVTRALVLQRQPES